MVKSDSIVLLVPGFAASENDTDCIPALQHFVRVLAERNPTVAIHVVSFQYPFTPDVYQWHRATVHALAGRNRRFPLRFLSWFKAILCVRRLAKSHRVLALHSMWLAECTYVGSWLAWMTGAKHVASIRGQDALPGNPYLKHFDFDTMIVTAVSESAAKTFQQSSGRAVEHIVPSGMPSNAIVPSGEAPERTIDILGVGSLTPIKDFTSFVEIVSSLVPDFPKLRVVIVGEGPERPRLEALIRQHRLEEIVQLAGHLPNEMVLQRMRQSRILLHTASYEAQAYVLLEALSSGMCVVCREFGYTGEAPNVYRCQSNREMIDVLSRLLTSPPPIERVEVLTIESTVEVFERIYGIR